MSEDLVEQLLEVYSSLQSLEASFSDLGYPEKLTEESSSALFALFPDQAHNYISTSNGNWKRKTEEHAKIEDLEKKVKQLERELRRAQNLPAQADPLDDEIYKQGFAEYSHG